MTTEGFCNAVCLAVSLFSPGMMCRAESSGKLTFTGTTRSGEAGTLTVDNGGAFAFSGNPDDIIAATLETAGRNTNA